MSHSKELIVRWINLLIMAALNCTWYLTYFILTTANEISQQMSIENTYVMWVVSAFGVKAVSGGSRAPLRTTLTVRLVIRSADNCSPRPYKGPPVSPTEANLHKPINRTDMTMSERTKIGPIQYKNRWHCYTFLKDRSIFIPTAFHQQKRHWSTNCEAFTSAQSRIPQLHPALHTHVISFAQEH